MTKQVIRGIDDAKDFDVLDKHQELVSENGPGSLTIEADSNPARVVWKFTPATDPIAQPEDHTRIYTDETKTVPTGG